MIFNLFTNYGFKNTDQIVSLCKAETGKIITSKLYSILSNRTHLIIKKNTNINYNDLLWLTAC